MKMHRNWPRIMRLTDVHLRTCAMLTQDEEALRILKQGCEDLFCSEPAPTPKVQLSIIRQWQRERGACDTEGVALDGAAGHFSIPHLYFWNPTDKELELSDLVVSPAMQAMLPRPLLVGMTIDYHGTELVVLETSDHVDSVQGDPIAYIIATPAAFIDPNK